MLEKMERLRMGRVLDSLQNEATVAYYRSGRAKQDCKRMSLRIDALMREDRKANEEREKAEELSRSQSLHEVGLPGFHIRGVSGHSVEDPSAEDIES